MGTNYYARRPACEHCGRADPSLHIGKSSAGWCFSLQVHAGEDINSWDDWMAFLTKPGITIEDEYGNTLNREEMREIVQVRYRPNAEQHWERDPPGYFSWADFHANNGSKKGPHGLLRATVGGNCIANGEGTWDVFSEEFF